MSIIPPKEELIKAIQDRINQRFAMRLRQAHGRLLVLGTGADADQTWANVNCCQRTGAVRSNYSVTEAQEIAEYGVPNTPAVLSVRERAKSVARVPSVEVVKEWIKELRG